MLPEAVIATSTISPLMMRLLISAGGARMIAILCSLVRSNAPASSVSTWFIARLVNTLISAASEAVDAANAMPKPIVIVIRERWSNRCRGSFIGILLPDVRIARV